MVPPYVVPIVSVVAAQAEKAVAQIETHTMPTRFEEIICQYIITPHPHYKINNAKRAFRNGSRRGKDGSTYGYCKK